MFCRAPNPTIATTSDTTLKIYGLNSSIIPVRERCWVAPLLVLLPPTLAILLALPVPLGMTEPHMMVSMPGDGAQLCTYAPGVSSNEKYGPYQSSVTILGFYLPSAIVICLLIGLSIRRCVACSGLLSSTQLCPRTGNSHQSQILPTFTEVRGTFTSSGVRVKISARPAWKSRMASHKMFRRTKSSDSLSQPVIQFQFPIFPTQNIGN